jgi:hypothetical protein
LLCDHVFSNDMTPYLHIIVVKPKNPAPTVLSEQQKVVSEDDNLTVEQYLEKKFSELVKVNCS